MSSFNFQSLKQRTYFDENTNTKNIKVCQQHIQKTRLAKKSLLQGFQLVDIVWVRPAEGRHKYQVLVRYIDPENPKTKRIDGSYQKIVKFGQKGVQDYVDAPHSTHVKDRNVNKIKSNRDNPLHANFYYLNLLNGPSNDLQQNLDILKKIIFS